MPTIICTVGTSIANGCPSLKVFHTSPIPWDGNPGVLADEITVRLGSINEIAEQSAELNSLNHLGVSESDRVILLATDTADGRCCAEQLRSAILRLWKMPDDQVKIERIEGLQVRDAERLRRIGLPNFIRIVTGHIESRLGEEVILNPTGGFKGIVPFLTVLGMIHRLRTVYIFEFAEQLISLPPLPFTFDLELFKRAEPALRFLEKEIAVAEQAYFSKIERFDPTEKELFLSFTEPYDEYQIGLSPLAFSLLQLATLKENVFIRLPAREQLNQVSGDSRLRLERQIESARNPLSRNALWHSLKGTNLIALKQPRTPERMLGFMHNNAFHITHVFSRHEDYERAIKTAGDKADYLKSAFAPWETPPDLSDKTLDQDILAEERDKLIVKTRIFTDQLKAKTAFAEDLELRLLDKEEKWRTERAALQSARDVALQESDRAHERIRKLEGLMGWRGFFKQLFGRH
ncbi:MAG: putative CRISPR-associated protein [Kiritimatiellia bacterium]